MELDKGQIWVVWTYFFTGIHPVLRQAQDEVNGVAFNLTLMLSLSKHRCAVAITCS